MKRNSQRIIAGFNGIGEWNGKIEDQAGDRMRIRYLELGSSYFFYTEPID